MKIHNVHINFSLLLLSLLPSVTMAATEQCITVIASGGITRPYWSQVINGAYKAGEELGISLYVRGTVNDKDAPAQKQIIETAIENKHCNAVVIAPSDSSINEVVAGLKQRDIPTIYVDRDTGGDRVAYVATDNYAAGVLAAQKMAQVLGDQGNVILFRLKQGVASTDAREQGFIDKARQMNLKIVADPYVGTRVGEARNIIKETLDQHTDIAGIFTPNDTTTIGTILVRQTLNRHKDAVHIGFDKTQFIEESLNKKELHGYITQNPYEMGYQGVLMAFKVLQGDTVTDQNTQVDYFE